MGRNEDVYYRIGNRIKDEWYLTEPETHTAWSAKINSNAGMRFNPMIKMVKWSRREYPTKKTEIYLIDTERKPATAFLFRLISQLQLSGTEPMINVEAYADWLTD